MNESHTQHLADRIVKVLDEQLTKHLTVRVYPTGTYQIGLSNGETRVFREQSATFLITPDELHELGGDIGSEKFMEEYIEPYAELVASFLKSCYLSTRQGFMLLTTGLGTPAEHSAPYHWTRQFTWRDLPMEIESRIVEKSWHLHFRFVVAVFEHS